MGVALGAGWGQPGPRGRGLNGAMLGSGVKWIRDGRGLFPLYEGPAGEDDKDVCKWQWFSPLILWSLFSFNIFVDN